ncbi:hypothetical protein FQN49_006068, partial [Arthroderma sp. PD_2]
MDAGREDSASSGLRTGKPEPGHLSTAGGDNTLQPPLSHGEDSWMAVLVSMEAATDAYRVKGDAHQLRAMQRNKALAMTLLSLTDMIPDQVGLSVLRGGLKTIFKLLLRRIGNGERILAAFEDIPITFSEACHALRAYPNDGLLRRFVEELYQTLLDVIPKLVEVLGRKHKVSLPRRILKQHPEHEAHVIDTSLEAVSHASHRVTVRVNNLASYIAVENLRETRNVGEGVCRAQEGMGKMLDGLDSIQSSQLEMEKRYEQQERKLHAFVESINQNLQQRLGDCEMQFRTGFFRIQDSLQGMIRYAHSPHLLPAGNTILCDNSSTWYDNLYMLLHIPDPVFIAADLGIILRASSNLGPTALGRASWLLNIDRFKSWAHVDALSSQLILVNGHLSGLTVGKISPLSVFAATFASMPKPSHVIILAHYCGLHSSPRDNLAGPKGMLRSLIAQLLLTQRNDNVIATTTLDETLLHNIASDNLEALCVLFQFLISQTRPSLTVYCILDNIS